jgi:hypothetical protein
MAIETLRPNGAGDDTEWGAWPSENANWQNVDEASQDGDATYNYCPGVANQVDLYHIDNHSAGCGVINKVTLYAWLRYVNTSRKQMYIGVKSGSTEDWGSFYTITNNWTEYSREFATDPNTGSAWTWDAIDALQIGIKSYTDLPGGIVTQVYIEVDYTDITEKTASDSGSGSDAKTLGSPLASLSKADSGSAAEGAPAQEATLTGSEAGSGMEVILSLLGKLVSDAGSGAENSCLAIITCARESCDGGAGADTSGLLAELAQDEAGSAVESLLSRLLHHEDGGGGNDAPVSLIAVLSRAENGSGAEALLSRLVTAAETALGMERLLSRKVGRYDYGSGAEASAIYKMLIASDGGSGLEALSGLIVLIPASELGHGSERLGAKIMTAPGAVDTKLPTSTGKVEVPRH